eukprot:TRINITY_DN3220_c0_g2_i3.p2 TRINITY_DN3220_c0_g2~~TRINITY_DN3220_c0_g2_i3.p2  ORF type:complete len:412 (+),score=-1.07 TRINITY_DN3220_c0_g2_i3:775-2010(+)
MYLRWLLPQQEVTNLLPFSSRRPADIWIPHWHLDRPGAFDLTINSVFHQPYFPDSSQNSSSFFTKAESNKCRLVQQLCKQQNIDFFPLVANNFGGWSKKSIHFSSNQFLFTKLNYILQQQNVIQLQSKPCSLKNAKFWEGLYSCKLLYHLYQTVSNFLNYCTICTKLCQILLKQLCQIFLKQLYHLYQTVSNFFIIIVPFIPNCVKNFLLLYNLYQTVRVERQIQSFFLYYLYQISPKYLLAFLFFSIRRLLHKSKDQLYIILFFGHDAFSYCYLTIIKCQKIQKKYFSKQYTLIHSSFTYIKVKKNTSRKEKTPYNKKFQVTYNQCIRLKVTTKKQQGLKTNHLYEVAKKSCTIVALRNKNKKSILIIKNEKYRNKNNQNNIAIKTTQLSNVEILSSLDSGPALQKNLNY